MFTNLIFDLDGTLIDSLPGIEGSLRAALTHLHPARSLAEGTLRPLVGPPLAKIVAALWPDLTEGEIAALVAAYRAHYLAEGCAGTPAFGGVADVLAGFRASGKQMFVLTNKPGAQTRLILGTLGWQDWFVEISCPDDPAHPFTSKEAGAVALRDRHALDPAASLLVGDAEDDARAAARAGFAFVAAGYGYGGAGHGISSGRGLASIGAFAELKGLVDTHPPAATFHDHPERLR